MTEHSLEYRESSTVCQVDVDSGAGYEVTLQPLSEVARFGTFSRKVCCFSAKGTGWSATRLEPNGARVVSIKDKPHTENIGGFWRSLWTQVPRAQRGGGASAAAAAQLPPAADADAFAAGLVHDYSCLGLSKRTLSAHGNGLLLLETSERGGCCLLAAQEHREAALLSDVYFVRLSAATCPQKWLCGASNGVEISLARDDFALVCDAESEGQASEFHAALLATQLDGRAPAAPLLVVSGVDSSVSIAPEFTTLERTRFGWAGEMWRTSHTLTVRTADIAYMQAKLPSFCGCVAPAFLPVSTSAPAPLIFTFPSPPPRPAFLRPSSLTQVIREAESTKFLGTGKDLAQNLLGYDLMAASENARQLAGLIVKFCLSLCVFFAGLLCRNTSLVLGGPGPGDAVLLPMAEADPESLLRSVAAAVAQAQQLHKWGRRGESPRTEAPTLAASAAAGAGKSDALLELREVQSGDPPKAAAAAAAAPPAAPAAAAAQWKRFIDAESGRPYWSNSATGACQWEDPAESIAQVATPPASQEGLPAPAPGIAQVATPPASQEGLPGTAPWQRRFDEESKWHYWLNTATGECKWEEEHAVAAQPTQPLAASRSPQYGRRAVAALPTVGATPAARAALASPDSAAAPPLQRRFQRHFDESSGRFFLLDEATGKSQWE